VARIRESPPRLRHDWPRIAVEPARQPGSGDVFTEVPVLTDSGVRVPDVAWTSAPFLKAHGETTPCSRAPERVARRGRHPATACIGRTSHATPSTAAAGQADTGSVAPGPKSGPATPLPNRCPRRSPQARGSRAAGRTRPPGARPRRASPQAIRHSPRAFLPDYSINAATRASTSSVTASGTRST